MIGTMALVPQVADAVRLPVAAAGGIADRRGVRNRYIDEMRAVEDAAPAYPVTNALTREMRAGLAPQ